ncbi:MAG TPA: prepilin-type N-terminal cleavage/methylation domain-containing protein [Pyrinomonadaceae bacterium]|nr:prepilin-type N-terminal cleavage/methylation domain-containing protein [Pyrinomonadaceae bacterium]
MRRPTDGADQNNEKGFTLLETSIALIVMMVVTLATASLFVYATNYNSGSGDRAAALAIAQQRLERLRRTPYSDTSMAAGTTTESVTSAGRSYTISTTICATSDCGGSSTLKIITISVTPVSTNQWANTPATITSERAAPSTGPYEGV